MAGHSHAKNVMHRKAVQGAKRARAYGKLIREITVAAKTGMPDPAHNPRLRAAVKAALTANMTRDTIARAITRVAPGAAGENYEEVRYAGYGPHGIAVIVEALTDNRNRTAADVRHLFAKHDGNLGEVGSVAWLFERRGVVVVDGEADEDELTLAAAEGGAEDVRRDGTTWEVTAGPEDLSSVREAVEAAGFGVESAELALLPKTTIEVADEAQARKILRLIDALEENDDVQEVYANFDIPERVLEEVAS